MPRYRDIVSRHRWRAPGLRPKCPQTLCGRGISGAFKQHTGRTDPRHLTEHNSRMNRSRKSCRALRSSAPPIAIPSHLPTTQHSTTPTQRLSSPFAPFSRVTRPASGACPPPRDYRVFAADRARITSLCPLWESPPSPNSLCPVRCTQLTPSWRVSKTSLPHTLCHVMSVVGQQTSSDVRPQNTRPTIHILAAAIRQLAPRLQRGSSRSHPCNALRAPQSPPFPARPGDVVSRPAASRPTGPPRSRPVGHCPARACTAQRLLELSPANCNCAGASAHASR